MNASTIGFWILKIQAFIAVGFVVALGFEHLNRRFRVLSAKQMSMLSLLLFLGTPIAVMGSSFLPRQNFITPRVQVWSAANRQAFKVASMPRQPVVTINSVGRPKVWRFGTAVFLISTVAGLFFLIRALVDWIQLWRVFRFSFCTRHYRSLRILSSDEIRIPFSFWLPFRALVFIPNSMLSEAADLKIAVLHELQHHRSRDTKWVHVLQLYKILFGVNPVVCLWIRRLENLQEFACDEALVGRQRVSAHAYASCLIQVAELALGSRRVFVGTTGMATGLSGKHLKERVKRMFQKSKSVGRISVVLSGVLVASFLVFSAFASQGVVRDRRVTMQEAQKLASLSADSRVPIVVNDLVLEQLNRYVGTPDGRAYVRDSLERMKNYRALIESKLKFYGLPDELLAVPVVESGYQNVEDNGKQWRGAGIWMFIKQTALNYKLRVDNVVDERLNVELETDAAMRYLGSNFFRFTDWALALLAYNVGEDKVQSGIEKTGSRDAWVLVRSGISNDTHYLPRVMAVALIMKNPGLLE